MTRNFIGVDLSKDWIDIHDPRRGAGRIDNAAAALGRFVGGLGPDDHLVFEATSGCDGLLIAAAASVGVAQTRLNPLHVWHFARSLNQAKTDRLDARTLARFGAERQPEPDPPACPARAALGRLVKRRDQLKRVETQEKNRLAEAGDAVVRQDILTSLAALGERIARIDGRIRDALAADPALSEQAALLQSIPGFGAMTAAGLLAHLPELGQCDRRAIASLGGLAPRARDSGKWRGARRAGDGRRQVTRTLYMAALSTLRRNSPLGGAADRLRAAGKPGKVVVIAMARKLLTIANAVIRDGQPFDENKIPRAQ